MSCSCCAFSFPSADNMTFAPESNVTVNEGRREEEISTLPPPETKVYYAPALQSYLPRVPEINLPEIISRMRTGGKPRFSVRSNLLHTLNDVISTGRYNRVNITFAVNASVSTDETSKRLSCHTLREYNPIRMVLDLFDRELFSHLNVDARYNLLTFGSTVSCNTGRDLSGYANDAHVLLSEAENMDAIEERYVKWCSILGNEGRPGRLVNRDSLADFARGERISLSGPITFAGATKYAIDSANRNVDGAEILLLLTNSAPTDGGKVVFEGKSYPMSPTEFYLRYAQTKRITICIVGIGDVDTSPDNSLLESLDNNLSSSILTPNALLFCEKSKRNSPRDIVCYAPFTNIERKLRKYISERSIPIENILPHFSEDHTADIDKFLFEIASEMPLSLYEFDANI